MKFRCLFERHSAGTYGDQEMQIANIFSVCISDVVALYEMCLLCNEKYTVCSFLERGTLVAHMYIKICDVSCGYHPGASYFIPVPRFAQCYLRHNYCMCILLVYQCSLVAAPCVEACVFIVILLLAVHFCTAGRLRDNVAHIWLPRCPLCFYNFHIALHFSHSLRLLYPFLHCFFVFFFVSGECASVNSYIEVLLCLYCCNIFIEPKDDITRHYKEF